LPAPFPESININNLSGQRLSEHFVAIKVGDVDLSAHIDGLQGVEGRHYPSALHLDVADRTLRAGERYALSLEADMSGILGLQAALRFNTEALEVEEIRGAFIEEHHLNRSYLKQGRLILSWNSSTPYPSEAVLMSLQLRARKACRLSEELTLDDNLLPAEAYDEKYQKLGFSLRWAAQQPENALIQNYPNPFSTRTTIRFEVTEAGPGRLELFRLDGNPVKSIEGFYPKGFNEVEISAAGLPGPGVYLYKLQVGQQHWVQKMVFSRD
jgi:hypothetical protein